MVFRVTAEVINVENVSQSVFSLVLKPEKKINFIPGQYVILQIKIDGLPVRRSYSIASKKEEENILLVIKNVKEGKVSKKLKDIKLGEQVILIGPAGNFIRRPTQKKELYIAVGTGIAPLRSMIYESSNEKILLLGARGRDEVLFRKEFEELENEKFKFYYCTTRENSNMNGRVQDNIKKIIFGTDYECYVCGLKEMVLETVAKLEELGIARSQIHFERYN